MKKVILLIPVIVFSNFVFAQFYPDWTDPVPITDSLSINSNPVILTTTANDVFCFYEKRPSLESPSQIWYRNIYTMTDEQLVFSNDSFEYRNPKMLTLSPYYDSRYFLIYESNETGVFDLYGVEFFPDGSFNESFKLTNTTNAESSFFINQGYDFQIACWKSGESIQFAHITQQEDTLQFEEIYTIDTNNCFEPICSNGYVFYRKTINDSSQIYFSHYNEATNLWTEPDTIYATGNNINMNTSMFTPEFFFESDIICWENNGHLFNWDSYSYSMEQVELEGITQCFEPDFLNYDLYTEYFNLPALLTFRIGEGNESEIFVSNYISSNGQVISNNNTPDSNPKLFYGPFLYPYFNAIDIWQSQINDNTVLCMSQASILLGGITDKDGNNNKFLKTSPNPFKNELKIEYFLSSNEKASLDIYTLTGKHIDHININSQKPGWNFLIWNTLENGKNNLPEGVYFVTLRQGNETATQKIIYAK